MEREFSFEFDLDAAMHVLFVVSLVVLVLKEKMVNLMNLMKATLHYIRPLLLSFDSSDFDCWIIITKRKIAKNGSYQFEANPIERKQTRNQS